MHDPHPELSAAYLAACQAGNVALADTLCADLDERGRLDEDAVAARLSAPGALGRAAEFYAAHGWHVFPLVAGGKTPATRRGFLDATVDVEEVRAWWAARPNANVGLATGEASGVDVIDLDGAQGVSSFYGGDGVRPPLLGRSRTPRPGGWHLYVPASGRGNRAHMRPGVDYRGNGGYVVLPPSWSAERNRRYRWVDVPGVLAGSTP